MKYNAGDTLTIKLDDTLAHLFSFGGSVQPSSIRPCTYYSGDEDALKHLVLDHKTQEFDWKTAEQGMAFTKDTGGLFVYVAKDWREPYGAIVWEWDDKTKQFNLTNEWMGELKRLPEKDNCYVTVKTFPCGE